jgi:hypothetical protein
MSSLLSIILGNEDPMINLSTPYVDTVESQPLQPLDLIADNWWGDSSVISYLR